jgi:hypothetical protein
VQVSGAAWRAATRIMTGVGDLVQRIRDDRTGRVLGGRAIERSGDTVCGLYMLSPEIDWSIWAKKRAAIKMGFEDNHGWSSESAPARVFLGQIRPCIFIVIRVQFS